MSKALRNILFVEDEFDIQRIVKLALETLAGMRIVGCTSGAEAVARATELPIDLILLDVMMPQTDGPTTLAHLRQIPALANTPVIFMTAKVHPDEIAHFKALGALDVISKPFDPLTLAATLSAIWDRAAIDAPTVNASEAGESSSETDASDPRTRYAARMAALAAQFESELPQRLDALRRQWKLLRDAWNFDALAALHIDTHNLAGTGATFGYDELTSRARSLDRHFKMLLEQQRAPDATLRQELDVLFAACEAELQRIIARLESS